MDMRMNFELLTPCVQHAEEANFRTEVSRVASDFQKCFGTGTEQEIVEDTLVLQNQRRQPVGQREDDVHVACREEFLFDAQRSTVLERPPDTLGSADFCMN